MDLNEMKDYYNRVFGKSPIKADKPLSSISYRLAGVLIKELDFYEPKKLPQRKKLAEMLRVSHQAILDSLAQLEDVDFIIRSNLATRIVYSDEGTQEQTQLDYKKFFKEELKSRRFNDEFYLNLGYNSTQEEKIYLLYKAIVKQRPQQVSAYEYISKLPETESKREILNQIVYGIIEDAKDVVGDIDKTIVVPIVERILKNSRLSIPIFIGPNKIPFVTVSFDNE